MKYLYFQFTSEIKAIINRDILIFVLLYTVFELPHKKPTICICENKDADQLRGNREADQRLCFRYTDSTIPLLSISKISSL